MGDLGPGNAEDEKEPPQKMTAAIEEAKRTIARSPAIAKGRTPLYRIPWVMFIGDQAAQNSVGDVHWQPSGGCRWPVARRLRSVAIPAAR